MKFLLLYTVGMLNLGLGYGIARWLKKRRRATTPQPANSMCDSAAEGSTNIVAKDAVEAGKEDRESTDQKQGRRSPDEALDELMRELREKSKFLCDQYMSFDGADFSAKELGGKAREIDAAIKEVLRVLNATVDVLSESNDSDERHEDIALSLEDYWSDINDVAVQLVTLTFEDEGSQSAERILENVAERISVICEKAHESLDVLRSVGAPTTAP